MVKQSNKVQQDFDEYIQTIYVKTESMPDVVRDELRKAFCAGVFLGTTMGNRLEALSAQLEVCHILGAGQDAVDKIFASHAARGSN